MKTKILMILITTIFLTSCNKEEGSEPEDTATNLAQTQNATEETIILSSILENGITIEGANKESGTPPSPNSNLSFELNTNSTEAFQNSGLKIEFSSDEQVAGAYIQFKDTEGNTTDSYFNVPSSSFNNSYYKNSDASKKKVLLKSSKNSLEDEFDNEIKIDFESAIPAGQFCYDICLYDDDNNVFQIQTVCVTVEAWGGNEAIVGEWILDRIEDEDNIMDINCSNGESITFEYQETIKQDFEFNINEDGTFTTINNSEFKHIDYDNTLDNCTIIYEDENELIHIKNYGNWAFNEEQETLTAVLFKVEDFINPEYNEEIENGELIIEGYTVEIISNQLVMTDNDYPIKAYFNRK